MATSKDNFIQSALKAKNNAVNGAKNMVARVQKNVAQGQSDYAAGKIPAYATINPFK